MHSHHTILICRNPLPLLQVKPLLGWSGVAIEPSKEACAKWRNNHITNNKLHLFELALGTQTGVQDFYENGSHLKKGDVSLLSTLMPKEIDRWKGTEQFVKKKQLLLHGLICCHSCR